MNDNLSAILSFAGNTAFGLPGISCPPAEEALAALLTANRSYPARDRNPAPLTEEIRLRTAEQGQHPKAAVICCADSRVPPEHIFSAGLGELFVIRNAGNLMGPFDVGSVEYAAAHLHVPLVLILGHRGCGAVASALAAPEEGGCLAQILAEVTAAIGGTRDAAEAEEQNLLHSLRALGQSETLRALHRSGAVGFAAGIYDIRTGLVDLLS